MSVINDIQVCTKALIGICLLNLYFTVLLVLSKIVIVIVVWFFIAMIDVYLERLVFLD
jgi:hypothetical protein